MGNLDGDNGANAWARFESLSQLKRDIAPALGRQRISLWQYYVGGTKPGFRHTEAKNRRATASTATCVGSLKLTGQWDAKDARGKPIAWKVDAAKVGSQILREPWKSSGLKKNNPFTTSFVLEAAGLLLVGCKLTSRLNDKMQLANEFLLDGPPVTDEEQSFRGLRKGLVSMGPHRASSFLTYCALRAIEAASQATTLQGRLTPKQQSHLRKLAKLELNEQTFLIAHKSRLADPMELAYAAALIAKLSGPRIQPGDLSAVRGGLQTFFEAQLEDGSWPLGQSLFTYPKVGPAYCHDYELLSALLEGSIPRPELLRYLPQLERAARRALATAIPTGPETVGWSSGHHRHIDEPESWSTAATFHFLHELDRLLAEAIRQAVFQALRQSYDPPGVPSDGKFAAEMLDCPPSPGGEDGGLLQGLDEKLVKPLQANTHCVRVGRPLPTGCITSAVFFGPPGTSKTKLAEYLAQALGWPLLKVHPAHFLKAGMDRVHAEADRVFDMLSDLEECVVLLDEIDELVRERGTAEFESRFLTTAMLPKLSDLKERRRIVWIAATNFVDKFDAAIGRPGRFDAFVQILPPTDAEKRRRWAVLKGDSVSMDWLTFAETASLAAKVTKAPRRRKQLVKQAVNDALLARKQSHDQNAKTWIVSAGDEAGYTRWP